MASFQSVGAFRSDDPTRLISRARTRARASPTSLVFSKAVWLVVRVGRPRANYQALAGCALDVAGLRCGTPADEYKYSDEKA